MTRPQNKQKQPLELCLGRAEIKKKRSYFYQCVLCIVLATAIMLDSIHKQLQSGSVICIVVLGNFVVIHDCLGIRLIMSATTGTYCRFGWGRISARVCVCVSTRTSSYVFVLVSCVCVASPRGGSARSALISLIHPQHIERKMEGWEGGIVLGGILVSSCLLLLLLLPHVVSSSRRPNPPKTLLGGRKLSPARLALPLMSTPDPRRGRHC